MGLRSSCASSWSFFFFPTCFSRMAPRLKDKVKPNRRARGSSDCGTPSITSILPLQYKEGLLWHQVSSGWLSRGLFSLVYCIKAIKVTITVLCLCLYWLILAYGIQNTWEKMCWAAHPPVSCLLPLSAQQLPPQVADCVASAAAVCYSGDFLPGDTCQTQLKRAGGGVHFLSCPRAADWCKHAWRGALVRGGRCDFISLFLTAPRPAEFDFLLFWSRAHRLAHQREQWPDGWQLNGGGNWVFPTVQCCLTN